jgi:glycine cleavage system H protein
MSIPKELKYTREHEWARLDGKNQVVVGVTDYAQESMGDIVFVELPPAGEDVTKDEPFGTVESTKSVSDLISPITGVVQESNTDLLNEPQIINEDAYGDGWIMRVAAESTDELDDLMSAAEYEEYIADLGDDH